MALKNQVVAGDYDGKQITHAFGTVSLSTSLFKSFPLDKSTVKEYEILDEDSRKSATSAVGRAFVGGILLGPVGWFAGLSAKTKSSHMIAIEFIDGNKSLIQLDKKAYRAFMKKMF